MPATPPQPPDDEGTPLLQRQGWGLPDSWPLMAAYHDGETLVCRAASAAEQVQPFIAQALRSAEPCSCEQDLPQADSRRWALEFTFVPQRTDGQRPQGLHVLLTDLTRHRTAERALLESEERLAKFMQASVEGIFFHQDGRVADANPALCELLGHTLHDLIGRNALDLVAPEQRSRVLHVGAAGKELTYETALLHRSGDRIPVEFIERNSLQQGRPMRMTIVRDLRDRHAAQARLHYLAHHDPLTGLPNRAAFLAQLEHLMVTARASGTQLALLFIDLDHFQRVMKASAAPALCASGWASRCAAPTGWPASVATSSCCCCRVCGTRRT